MEAVRTLGATVENKAIDGSKDDWAAVPSELVERVADRIQEATELGDVVQIQSIAEELLSDSDVVKPFCDELKRLTEDFDLDGIRKLMLQFESAD